MRIHTYVIATDAGSAPNYDPPFTTLAVCKPRIRRKANVGELVLAFAGKSVNPYEPHSVVWAGVVAEKFTFADYWNDKRFQAKKPDRCTRPDNFYRPTTDGGLLWVENPVHGPEATQHDTDGLYVLAFNPSWRFGANGPPLPTEFGLRMTHGRRGERVMDLSDAERRRLETWLEQQTALTTPAPRSNRACPPSQRNRCHPHAPEPAAPEKRRLTHRSHLTAPLGFDTPLTYRAHHARHSPFARSLTQSEVQRPRWPKPRSP